MDTIRHHFGLRCDPFPQNINVKDLYPLPALEPLKQRISFAIDQKAISVITGDVGTGKSTSLRYVSNKLHSSAFELITIVGGSYSNYGAIQANTAGIRHKLQFLPGGANDKQNQRNHS